MERGKEEREREYICLIILHTCTCTSNRERDERGLHFSYLSSEVPYFNEPVQCSTNDTAVVKLETRHCPLVTI